MRHSAKAGSRPARREADFFIGRSRRLNMALNWLKGKFNEVSKGLKDEVTRIKNTTFLEGVIAGCTVVAYADGVVKAEEKQKMMGFLKNNDMLSVFDTG